MDELKFFWNKSTSNIPSDKDPSNYAVEKEKFFPRTAKVCDLGGGTGVDSIYFIGRGHMVTLTDISDLALQIAVKKAKESGIEGQLKVVPADFTTGNLPLQSGEFDIVFSRLALHYFPSERLSELFKEVFRILKPGGKAFITLKSPDDKEEMQFLKKSAVELEEGVFKEGGQVKTRFTTKKINKILTDSGIKNFEVNSYEESFEGRNDRVKSGKVSLLLNEIIISK